MHFICVDLHKQVISVCVITRVGDQRRVVSRRTLRCDRPEQIQEFFGEFVPFQFVVEATSSYEWFVQLLEPLAERIVLAHPKKLRIIAESTKKTDELDAQVLAEFLSLDMIPAAHRAAPGCGNIAPWCGSGNTCSDGSLR
jgi:transposase